MRDILFKAKRIDNGEWVEGYVFDDGFVDRKRMFVGGLVIMDYKGTANDRWEVGTAFYEVDPNTICQYTGLTDKNGNKIWENDVVRYYDELVNMVKEDLVKWNETHASFTRLHESRMGLQYLYIDEGISNRCEVIGNIFDNPELIKESD